MFEKFTERARKVMQLANGEACRFNHEYIGTEHILLGLIKEGSGIAVHVLRNLSIDLRRIRVEVEKLIKGGSDMVIAGRLPQTPCAKKVIEYAYEESRVLNHNWIGTEHILLGLLREPEGVASQVLMCLGMKLDEARVKTLEFAGKGHEDQPTPEELRSKLDLLKGALGDPKMADMAAINRATQYILRMKQVFTP